MKEILNKMWTKIKNNKKVKKVFFNTIALLIVILVTIIATLFVDKKIDTTDTIRESTPDSSPEEEIQNSKPNVDLKYLSAFLARTSELTTGKLKTRGYLDYTAEKGIPWITQEAFGMIYEAEIRAGIHLEQVIVHGVDENSRIVYITLPDAEILSANVNPKEIKYIDKKFTLFPANEMEHANKAQAVAQEDALKYGMTTGILEFADEHAKTLFNNLCNGLIQDCTVEFVDENFDISSVNTKETKETDNTEIEETSETNNNTKAE